MTIREQAIELNRQIDENRAKCDAIGAQVREMDQADSKDWSTYDALEAQRDELRNVGLDLCAQLSKSVPQMTAEDKTAVKAARAA